MRLKVIKGLGNNIRRLYMLQFAFVDSITNARIQQDELKKGIQRMKVLTNDAIKKLWINSCSLIYLKDLYLMNL